MAVDRNARARVTAICASYQGRGCGGQSFSTLPNNLVCTPDYFDVNYWFNGFGFAWFGDFWGPNTVVGTMLLVAQTSWAVPSFRPERVKLRLRSDRGNADYFPYSAIVQIEDSNQVVLGAVTVVFNTPADVLTVEIPLFYGNSLSSASINFLRVEQSSYATCSSEYIYGPDIYCIDFEGVEL